MESDDTNNSAALSYSWKQTYRPLSAQKTIQRITKIADELTGFRQRSPLANL